MLTDLVQATATNKLAQPRLIMHLLTKSPMQPSPPPPTNILQNETMFFDWYGTELYIGPNSTDIPVVNPAVIATQYFCQIPRLKSTGSLLIAIIVADLVFLQVLWKVLNLAVTFGLTRRHRGAVLRWLWEASTEGR